jgi:hypothetical protein
MPSKAAQLIAFFGVLTISVSLHRYVFLNLKRVILRDYPRIGERLVRAALVLFIIMDSPFVFLFVKSKIHESLTVLTRALIYPFSVWQALMLVWAALLVPVSIWRRRERLGARVVRNGLRRVRNSRTTLVEEDTYDTPALEIVTE